MGCRLEGTLPGMPYLMHPSQAGDSYCPAQIMICIIWKTIKFCLFVFSIPKELVCAVVGRQACLSAASCALPWKRNTEQATEAWHHRGQGKSTSDPEIATTIWIWLVNYLHLHLQPAQTSVNRHHLPCWCGQGPAHVHVHANMTKASIRSAACWGAGGVIGDGVGGTSSGSGGVPS